MKVMNHKRALLIPANPVLQRTISNGIYFFHGKPIHESGFNSDPEFPITSSNITDMLHSGNTPLHVIKPEQSMPYEGIIVGEVKNENDLKAWANIADPATTLIAGASGFFLSIFDTIAKPTNPSVINNSVNHPVLLVCGSAFNKSQSFVKKEKDNGRPVNYMPDEIIDAENPTNDQYDRWAADICDALRRNGRTIIAIDPDTMQKKTVTPISLRTKTAHVVREVFQRTSIPELMLEGGSTAAAILNELKISKLFPIKEVAPGVVRMRVDNVGLPAGKTSHLHITFKPGSYEWPAGSWAFNHTN
jgi:uncharacterized protein YgbK (DUF1537 family)